MTDDSTLPTEPGYDARPYKSTNFTLHELTDGVWAAIAKPFGFAGSNAGIIDLGDRTVIFDTTLAPVSASELARAAEHLTGRPPAIAINSHHHADHVQGNQALPSGIPIISTARTRELVLETLPRSIADRRKQVPQQVADLEQQLLVAQTPDERQEIAQGLAFWRQVQEQVALLHMRPPTVTFDGRVALHGPARHAEVITLGGGHTESDAILWLPDDGIVFAADLLFYRMHAWAGDGDPREWLRILGEIEAFEPPFTTIVPGHGTVAPREGFDEQRRYLQALVAALDHLQSQESSSEVAANTPVPEPYAAWDGADRWGNNLRALVDK